MSLTAIIQARMGSSRLPGKVALPLDGVPVIKHDIRRAFAAPLVDDVVVATTFHRQDDIVAEYAREEGADVYRGSEDDVLGRLHRASSETGNDVFVRLTGDNPLVPPELIDTVGDLILRSSADHVSNKMNRTFPLGADAEALTVDCLSEVEAKTRDPYYREHATKYIRENADEFRTRNVTANGTYGGDVELMDPDIRLTLDVAEDYELFRRLYSEVEYDETLEMREAVRYLRTHDLEEINGHISQETL